MYTEQHRDNVALNKIFDLIQNEYLIRTEHLTIDWRIYENVMSSIELAR